MYAVKRANGAFPFFFAGFALGLCGDLGDGGALVLTPFPIDPCVRSGDGAGATALGASTCSVNHYRTGSDTRSCGRGGLHTVDKKLPESLGYRFCVS